MKVKKYIAVFGCLAAFLVSCNRPESQMSISLPLAETYFKEVSAIVEKDGGKLWGNRLDSPFLFVDGATGDVAANEADDSGILKENGSLFTGKFPEDGIVANSVTQLGNKKFTMVQWSEYPDRLSRNALFIHELFHYWQSELGHSKPDGMEIQNNQLNEKEGRIYLKLEWSALNKAVNSNGSARLEAVRDALIFRKYRQDLYQCAEAENELIIQEGLPEYTGITLASESLKDKIKLLNSTYDSILLSDSYVRSFAYYSGPAYGILLDDICPNWRQGLLYSSDLGELLAESYCISISGDEAELRRSEYGYNKIYQEEDIRKRNLEEQLKQYENLLVNGPTVMIYLTEPQVGFDPAGLVPYKDIGTIYSKINITDAFGTLEVTDQGCLLSNDWGRVAITAQDLSADKNKIKGKGWTVELNKGYELIQEEGQYIIKKKVL